MIDCAGTAPPSGCAALDYADLARMDYNGIGVVVAMEACRRAKGYYVAIATVGSATITSSMSTYPLLQPEW
jgi:hypothetical protein